ncbi:MAG: DegT/DnrJ/EryC1/StrS family aminotransferase, partial [Abditibacteriales bacterium]|nr:DegT/DnrJ/EryC1/StrS family aminotransferase [Abditibacteriales bacterium]MDW8368528.1 DegT/DnrJ/EryC1/StrS family aminotransferase [Abditibacteriales bacterium]
PPWPQFDETDEQALVDVLRSGQWGSTSGSRVHEFEKAFAEFTGARFATCVTNGTAALEIALMAVGVGIGDEVIVPPYTFVATASSVLSVGAVPIFVDIEPDTFNLDATKIEAALTPRTKAIIPVHMGGCPANMDAIMEVARQHNLRVIEDAAQAHGATWKGVHVGNFGDAGTFSFQSSKNLNSGEGGAVITNDPEVDRMVWSIHNVGRRREGAWYEHPVLGSNFRMTEFQGALLLSQMRRLRQQIEIREANGKYLSARLAELGGLTPCKRDERVTTHAWHLFMMRYDTAQFGGVPRHRFVQALNAEGIPCNVGYGQPLYREEVFHQDRRVLRVLQAHGGGVDYSQFNCPVAEQVCREAVWFYQSTLLGTKEDTDDIVTAVAKIKENVGELQG